VWCKYVCVCIHASVCLRVYESVLVLSSSECCYKTTDEGK
jgi:hypothetical protein